MLGSLVPLGMFLSWEAVALSLLPSGLADAPAAAGVMEAALQLAPGADAPLAVETAVSLDAATALAVDPLEVCCSVLGGSNCVFFTSLWACMLHAGGWGMRFASQPSAHLDTLPASAHSPRAGVCAARAAPDRPAGGDLFVPGGRHELHWHHAQPVW